jgi:hypothetical protein
MCVLKGLVSFGPKDSVEVVNLIDHFNVDVSHGEEEGNYI